MFTDSDLIDESKKLQRFAHKLTRNASDADDLLQNTLLKAIEKRQQFQADSSLFSWTAKIMFNQFVSNYRKKARYETQYDPDWYIAREISEPDQEPSAELANALAAMQRLSADHREILTLIGINGMRYAEVSELLAIPVGTVRSRLSRARESLHAAMNTAQVSISTATLAGLHQRAANRSAAGMTNARA
ncbi:MAG TPA: RNA polymerase sigma factor [Spongiibacteraceae bacterium]|nr:RNA polymerase sigma factor [Spongiibacteraceae bacterium]HUH36893.1 RNA polymerase sigma factor [Spongiibacteraceae bacterium]